MEAHYDCQLGLLLDFFNHILNSKLLNLERLVVRYQIPSKLFEFMKGIQIKACSFSPLKLTSFDVVLTKQLEEHNHLSQIDHCI